jgi:hypothetical protein
MVKALHDPIIIQDLIRLHCFAWVVGNWETIQSPSSDLRIASA